MQAEPATRRPESSVGSASVLLEVSEVSVRFGGIAALDHISFSLGSGCCGMIGPNGAGKTTLLDSLSGLRRPTSGSVRMDGGDITHRSASWLARAGVRRTFQRHQPFGWLTVEENLLVPLEWRGRSRRIIADMLSMPSTRRRVDEFHEQIDAVIERCGLERVRNVAAGALPIGQIRLLEFARAIIGTPRLLLLDEPTSGLGGAESEQMASVVRELTDEGCTIMLVEHDLEFVLGLCDRVIVLEQGRLLADDTPTNVRTDPAVIAAYIGED
jgi:branched-chain amino acid transport system ATP-binding protein